MLSSLAPSLRPGNSLETRVLVALARKSRRGAGISRQLRRHAARLPDRVERFIRFDHPTGNTFPSVSVRNFSTDTSSFFNNSSSFSNTSSSSSSSSAPYGRDDPAGSRAMDAGSDQPLIAEFIKSRNLGAPGKSGELGELGDFLAWFGKKGTPPKGFGNFYPKGAKEGEAEEAEKEEGEEKEDERLELTFFYGAVSIRVFQVGQSRFFTRSISPPTSSAARSCSSCPHAACFTHCFLCCDPG